MSIIGNLVKKTKTSNRPLEILSFFYDGKFDIELLKTGHNFYGTLDFSAYAWPAYENKTFKNLKFIVPQEYGIRNFDFLIINHRERQRQYLNLARQLHLPALIIDHDTSQLNTYQLYETQLPFNSISTNGATQQLYNNKLIDYGVEEFIGAYDKDIDILICGNFAQNDYGFIHHLKTAFPQLKVVGYNQLPYSETVSSYSEYKNLFKRTNIFINLTSQLNTNYELLWAMTYKCHIISNKVPAYNNIAGTENINFTENIDDVLKTIKNIIYNPQLKSKTIDYPLDFSKYSEVNFINSWKAELENYRNKVYIA